MTHNVTFPKFGSYVCVGDTVSIEIDGFTLIATVHDDSDAGAPWDNQEGTGDVSDWTSRDKRPGERVLSSDRSLNRYYDFEGAMHKAKVEGWGGPLPLRTEGMRRLAAVEADFAALKAWCDDEWHYVGVSVTVERAGVELVGEFEHALWGIECNYPNSDNAYLSEAANDYIAEALESARAKLLELA